MVGNVFSDSENKEKPSSERQQNIWEGAAIADDDESDGASSGPGDRKNDTAEHRQLDRVFHLIAKRSRAEGAAGRMEGDDLLTPMLWSLVQEIVEKSVLNEWLTFYAHGKDVRRIYRDKELSAPQKIQALSAAIRTADYDALPPQLVSSFWEREFANYRDLLADTLDLLVDIHTQASTDDGASLSARFDAVFSKFRNMLANPLVQQLASADLLQALEFFLRYMDASSETEVTPDAALALLRDYLPAPLQALWSLVADIGKARQHFADNAAQSVSEQGRWLAQWMTELTFNNAFTPWLSPELTALVRQMEQIAPDLETMLEVTDIYLSYPSEKSVAEQLQWLLTQLAEHPRLTAYLPPAIQTLLTGYATAADGNITTWLQSPYVAEHAPMLVAWAHTMQAFVTAVQDIAATPSLIIKAQKTLELLLQDSYRSIAEQWLGQERFDNIQAHAEILGHAEGMFRRMQDYPYDAPLAERLQWGMDLLLNEDASAFMEHLFSAQTMQVLQQMQRLWTSYQAAPSDDGFFTGVQRWLGDEDMRMLMALWLPDEASATLENIAGVGALMLLAAASKFPVTGTPAQQFEWFATDFFPVWKRHREQLKPYLFAELVDLIDAAGQWSPVIRILLKSIENRTRPGRLETSLVLGRITLALAQSQALRNLPALAQHYLGAWQEAVATRFRSLLGFYKETSEDKSIWERMQDTLRQQGVKELKNAVFMYLGIDKEKARVLLDIVETMENSVAFATVLGTIGRNIRRNGWTEAALVDIRHVIEEHMALSPAESALVDMLVVAPALLEVKRQHEAVMSQQRSTGGHVINEYLDRLAHSESPALQTLMAQLHEWGVDTATEMVDETVNTAVDYALEKGKTIIDAPLLPGADAAALSAEEHTRSSPAGWPVKKLALSATATLIWAGFLYLLWRADRRLNRRAPDNNANQQEEQVPLQEVGGNRTASNDRQVHAMLVEALPAVTDPFLPPADVARTASHGRWKRLALIAAALLGTTGLGALLHWIWKEAPQDADALIDRILRDPALSTRGHNLLDLIMERLVQLEKAPAAPDSSPLSASYGQTSVDPAAYFQEINQSIPLESKNRTKRETDKADEAGLADTGDSEEAEMTSEVATVLNQAVSSTAPETIGDRISRASNGQLSRAEIVSTVSDIVLDEQSLRQDEKQVGILADYAVMLGVLAAETTSTVEPEKIFVTPTRWSPLGQEIEQGRDKLDDMRAISAFQELCDQKGADSGKVLVTQYGPDVTHGFVEAAKLDGTGTVELFRKDKHKNDIPSALSRIAGDLFRIAGNLNGQLRSSGKIRLDKMLAYYPVQVSYWTDRDMLRQAIETARQRLVQDATLADYDAMKASLDSYGTQAAVDLETIVFTPQANSSLAQTLAAARTKLRALSANSDFKALCAAKKTNPHDAQVWNQYGTAFIAARNLDTTAAEKYQIVLGPDEIPSGLQEQVQELFYFADAFGGLLSAAGDLYLWQATRYYQIEFSEKIEMLSVKTVLVAVELARKADRATLVDFSAMAGVAVRAMLNDKVTDLAREDVVLPADSPTRTKVVAGRRKLAALSADSIFQGLCRQKNADSADLQVWGLSDELGAVTARSKANRADMADANVRVDPYIVVLEKKRPSVSPMDKKADELFVLARELGGRLTSAGELPLWQMMRIYQIHAQVSRGEMQRQIAKSKEEASGRLADWSAMFAELAQPVYRAQDRQEISLENIYFSPSSQSRFGQALSRGHAKLMALSSDPIFQYLIEGKDVRPGGQSVTSLPFHTALESVDVDGRLVHLASDQGMDERNYAPDTQYAPSSPDEEHESATAKVTHFNTGLAELFKIASDLGGKLSGSGQASIAQALRYYEMAKPYRLVGGDLFGRVQNVQATLLAARDELTQARLPQAGKAAQADASQQAPMGGDTPEQIITALSGKQFSPFGRAFYLSLATQWLHGDLTQAEFGLGRRVLAQLSNTSDSDNESGDVFIGWLELFDCYAEDIVHVADKKSEVQLLVIPSSDKEWITGFKNEEELKLWVAETLDEDGSDFIDLHFSINDARIINEWLIKLDADQESENAISDIAKHVNTTKETARKVPDVFSTFNNIDQARIKKYNVFIEDARIALVMQLAQELSLDGMTEEEAERYRVAIGNLLTRNRRNKREARERPNTDRQSRDEFLNNKILRTQSHRASDIRFNLGVDGAMIISRHPEDKITIQAITGTASRSLLISLPDSLDRERPVGGGAQDVENKFQLNIDALTRPDGSPFFTSDSVVLGDDGSACLTIRASRPSVLILITGYLPDLSRLKTQITAQLDQQWRAYGKTHAVETTPQTTVETTTQENAASSAPGSLPELTAFEGQLADYNAMVNSIIGQKTVDPETIFLAPHPSSRLGRGTVAMAAKLNELLDMPELQSLLRTKGAEKPSDKSINRAIVYENRIEVRDGMDRFVVLFEKGGAPSSPVATKARVLMQFAKTHANLRTNGTYRLAEMLRYYNIALPGHTPLKAAQLGRAIVAVQKKLGPSQEVKALMEMPLEKSEQLRQRHGALYRTRRELQKEAPSFHESGKKYVEDFIKKHFNKQIDADQTYINIFRPHVLSRPVQGVLSLAQMSNAGAPLYSSIPIWHLATGNTQDLTENITEGGDRLDTFWSFPSMRTVKIGNSNDPGQRFRLAEPSIIDPSALATKVADPALFDFAKHYEDAVNLFYDQNLPRLKTLAQHDALLEAETQHVIGKLSAEDFALVKTALTNSDTDGSDKVETYPLTITDTGLAGHQEKYISTDSLVIKEKSSGRLFLYLAGDPSPIRIFPNLDALNTWFVGETDKGFRITAAEEGDNGWLRQFAETHFYGDANYGGAGWAERWRISLIERLQRDRWARKQHRPLAVGARITLDASADPFGQLVTSARKGAHRAAYFEITTHADITRKHWREALATIPVPFVGSVPNVFLNKTQEEYQQSLIALGIDVAMSLPGLEELGLAKPAVVESRIAQQETEEVAGAGLREASEAEQKLIQLPGGIKIPGVAHAGTPSGAAAMADIIGDIGYYRPVEDGLDAYKSRSVAGTPDAKTGLYTIDGKTHAPIGDKLYQVGADGALVRKDQTFKPYTPIAKRNADRSFSAVPRSWPSAQEDAELATARTSYKAGDYQAVDGKYSIDGQTYVRVGRDKRLIRIEPEPIHGTSHHRIFDRDGNVTNAYSPTVRKADDGKYHLSFSGSQMPRLRGGAPSWKTKYEVTNWQLLRMLKTEDFSREILEPGRKKLLDKILSQRKLLLDDARSYFAAKVATPGLKLPNIGKFATDAEIIDIIYQEFKGILLGESHDEINAIKFIMDNMEVLQKNGVKTVYIELPREEVQALLDSAFATKVIDDRLGVISVRQGNKWKIPKGHRLRDLVEACNRHGIRVQALDTHVAQYDVIQLPMRDVEHSAMDQKNRLEMFNFQAHEVIRRDQEANPGNWIGVVGRRHLSGDAAVNVPIGLVEMLPEATGIAIDSETDLERAITRTGNENFLLLKTLGKPPASVV